MTPTSPPPELGRPSNSASKRGGTWVQTERAAHEAWGRLLAKKPTAGALLHLLVAKIGPQNAVVVSQVVLAQLLGVSDKTIRQAVKDLAADKWIQVVRIGKGRECAYVVNDRVAWTQSRDKLNLSLFSATIVADSSDQDAATLEGVPLRQIPVLFAGERQLPTGPGETPPSQPPLEGLEPDLPALRHGETVDDATGEILQLDDPWAHLRGLPAEQLQKLQDEALRTGELP